MVVQYWAAVVRKAVKGLPFSYSRKYRLATKAEVQSVFADKPGKISRKYLLVLYKSNQLPYARLGMIVGKKHLRRAVDRNRVRRVIRESFRHEREKLKGLDFVVMIRSDCSLLENQAIKNEIGNVWQAIIS